MPEPEDSFGNFNHVPTKRLSSLFKLIKVSPPSTFKNPPPKRHDDHGDSNKKLQENMQANWNELPSTLRRKLRSRDSILAEFTADECDSNVKISARTMSTDSLLSSSSSTGSTELPPPELEEEHDSGTDVTARTGGSIISSDDEQQKERGIEECVRQDAVQVINFVDDGAYEDVIPAPQVIKVEKAASVSSESLNSVQQSVEFPTSPKETVLAEIHYSQVQIKDRTIVKEIDNETKSKFQLELMEKLTERSLRSSQNNSQVSKLSVQDLFDLAACEINKADGSKPEGSVDTLKDIQETLLRLEEKVRQYESRLAVEHGCKPASTTTAAEQVDQQQKQQRNGLAYNNNNVQANYPSGSTEQDGWTRGANFGQYPGVAPVPAEQSMQPMLATGRMGESGRSNSLVHDGRHSLLQFAMLHFRQSPEKFEMLKTADGSISGSLKVIENMKNKKSKKKSKDSDWTWKEQVDLVKFSPELPKESLLRLDPPELSDLAVECFASIMRYMGDLAMPADVTEVKCVYTILMHCHKHEALRDEVYCQIMKQTTNNKSHNSDSCQRGWRLFSILAAYFVCSDTLKPYLYKYLETAAYDKRRAYHGTATVCLQNLRKTFKYGGRKNVPSVEEITAISAGRNSKRQIYRLPGGTERVINTKSTTVVQDIIEEICGVIGVRSPPETEEFSLYCIVEGDAFTMPLAREEYVLDVTTELHKNQQVFYLIFCRSVWYFPMRLDSPLYVEVVFNQVAPDYLEGLLLVMPGEQLDQELVYDIAKVAALLHRAADMSHVPAMKETKFLLPRPALAVRDIKPPQWVNMVQGSWQEVESLSTVHAKAQVLDILQKWPLFGSSFFAVKRVSDPKERSDHILALNRQGVHFLDLVTHETLMHYPFSEVISTRKVKTEDGILFLDMKCGNLMQQRITRLQTDQAHEISRLIRQYITMEQRQRGGDNPADVSLNPR